MRNLSATPPAFSPAPKVSKEKVLLLPQTNHSATHAVEYLCRREIDDELIDFSASRPVGSMRTPLITTKINIC